MIHNSLIHIHNINCG